MIIIKKYEGYKKMIKYVLNYREPDVLCSEKWILNLIK